MSKSYRLGIQIVLGTLIVSGAVCWLGVSRSPGAPARASHDLGPGAWAITDFQLTERSGRPVSLHDLRDRVWIAAFIFTRCPLSCPRISGVMKGLQDRLASANVLLVSISVDPDHDTPPVLREYAERFGALPDRWWFLTGAKPAIQALVTRDFKLALTETTPSDGVEAFTHSDRLALVDGDRVVGFFETGDETALEDLVVRARRLGLPQWVRGLPAVNASLNALCAVLLVNGWLLIRRKESRLALGAWSSADSASSSTSLLGPVGARAHGLCMLLAVATSALFLGCYLVYHYYAGSVPFPHPGARRWLYLSILLSHTLLATFGVVPLVLFTLYRALKGQYRKHASIAQITFPVWLYVSVTGVVIYLMLYHWPVASVTG